MESLERVIKQLELSREEAALALRQLVKPQRKENYSKHHWNEKHVRIGVISDTHIGSKYFNYQAYEDSLRRLKDVDAIYHCGDVVEGMSNREGHIYELEKIGLSNQLDYATELLGQYKPHIYFTSANHDEWGKNKANQGILVGPEIERRIPKKATFLGEYTANIELANNVVLRLTHEGANAYALSYSLQKRVNALEGGTKPQIICFEGDCEVVMHDGSIKPISEVKIGDKVITHLGNTKNVKETFESEHEVVIDIVPFGIPNNRIRCSKDHPFLILRDGKIIWEKAKNINKKDWLARPIIKETHNVDSIDLIEYLQKHFYRIEGDKIRAQNGKLYNRKIKITDEFCRLIGLFVAEGYVDNSRLRTCFAFNKNEEEYTKFVMDTIKQMFGVDGIIQDRKNTLTRVIRFNDMIFSDFMASLVSKYASNKDFPNWFLYLPTRLQNEALRGLFEGDGTKSNDYYKLSTTSAKLVEQVLLISARLGLAAGYSKQTRKGKNYIGKMPAFTVRCRHNKDLGSKWYNGVPSTTSITNFIFNDGNFVWHKLRKINTIQRKTKMYNLEVEDDNSYLVSSICAHNCNGHIHKMLYMWYRSIHCAEAGTFQSQTPFMALKGTPAHVGYWIFDINFDKRGITSFKQEARTFY